MSTRQSVLFAVLMALGMSLVMSFAMTVATMGFPPDFVSWWLRGLVAGFLAAVPTALVIAPIARNVVDAVFTERSHG